MVCITFLPLVSLPPSPLSSLSCLSGELLQHTLNLLRCLFSFLFSTPARRDKVMKVMLAGSVDSGKADLLRRFDSVPPPSGGTVCPTSPLPPLPASHHHHSPTSTSTAHSPTHSYCAANYNITVFARDCI